MPDFDYLALDTAGRERRGSVRAASPDDARATLSVRKLYVVRVEASTGATAPPLFSRGGSQRSASTSRRPLSRWHGLAARPPSSGRCTTGCPVRGGGTVLLADGNVGIGGDPLRLLSRARDLLAREGALLVEADPPGSPSRPVRLRLEDDLGTSEEFPWALLAVDDVPPVAREAGLRPAGIWEEAGRWFATLVRP